MTDAAVPAIDPEVAEDLNDKFGKLPPEIIIEFQSMLRLYDIDAQELFFKWESYCMKMGSEDTKLTHDTARAFKKDTQEQFESQAKGKAKMIQTGVTAKSVQRTPRNISSSGDMFGMLNGAVPTTPRTGASARKPAGSSVKSQTSRAPYETPVPSKGRHVDFSSPMGPPNQTPRSSFAAKLEDQGISATPFHERRNAGQVMETLNPHLQEAELPLESGSYENRVSLVVNVDVKKFSYRPMYVKLLEASEYLDDRIDEYALLVQREYDIKDEEFGNPANPSQEETVVVGRIVCDSLEGRLNPSSLVIESSRMMSNGARIPLKMDNVNSFSFFPGMLVALRGVNPNGDFFAVNSIIEEPRFVAAASTIDALEGISQRLSSSGLSVVIASGPYTTSDDLEYRALDELCDQMAEKCPDVLILLGPFIDTDHPKVVLGDFTLESKDTTAGTLDTLFREKITSKIRKIEKSLVLMIPHTRDAVCKHVSYPQEPFNRPSLGLPKENVKLLTNPCMFSLNEIVFGVSTADILFHVSRDEAAVSPAEKNAMGRISSHVIKQRHFYPLFPPPAKTSLTGGSNMPIDTPNLRLCEFASVTPDVLILPSQLMSFAKIVESVVTINPGSLSKAKASGTYASMTIHPPNLDSVNRSDIITHKVYERARVDVKRI